MMPPSSSPPSPLSSPRLPTSVALCSVQTEEDRDGFTKGLEPLSAAYRLLENSMGYTHPGSLWATLCAAPRRRLPGGGVEYTVPFPRPADLPDCNPLVVDGVGGKRLPAGRYLGTVSLVLSNPDWCPSIGSRAPGVAFTVRGSRGSHGQCLLELILEDLRALPEKEPAAMPSVLKLEWERLKAALRETFFPEAPT